MWLALLGLHLVGLVGFNLLLRRSVLDRVDRFTLATIAQTGIAIPAIVLLIVRPPNFSIFSIADFIYLACTVVLTIGLQITNVKALQYLEASVYSVLYNLRIILTTVLGILFLHEAILGLRIAGGVLILLAIIIVKQQNNHSLRMKGIFWGITAATVISFLNLAEKLLIIHVGFLNYFPVESVIALVMMWTYLLVKKRDFNWTLLLQPRMAQLMALRAASAYGFSGALATGALISVANYISGMSVIFMVILGALLLNERDYLRRKIIATVLAVLGLSIVLLSSV